MRLEFLSSSAEERSQIALKATANSSPALARVHELPVGAVYANYATMLHDRRNIGDRFLLERPIQTDEQTSGSLLRRPIWSRANLFVERMPLASTQTAPT